MKKYFTLLVAGEEYKLRLTAGSIMAIEKKLQKPLFAALESIQENMVETITTILGAQCSPLTPTFRMITRFLCSTIISMRGIRLKI